MNYRRYSSLNILPSDAPIDVSESALILSSLKEERPNEALINQTEAISSIDNQSSHPVNQNHNPID
jgi:hypothetical protein